MGALRLVPSNGLRAQHISRSTKPSTAPSSTTSSRRPPPEPPSQSQTYLHPFHTSWHSTPNRTPSPPHPFIATLEPTDPTPEVRAQNILTQKVLLLAAELFPRAACSADLRVEYVGGGSYHHVVGISVPMPQPAIGEPSSAASNTPSAAEGGRYVVRIPRDDVGDPHVDLQREVAVLKGLEGQLEVRIPRVVAFDVSTENALGAPYTLETRLRGCSLEDLLGGDASEAQTESAFRQVVRLVEDLARITAPYGGWVTESGECGIDERVSASRLPVRLFSFPFEASSLASLPDQTPLTFMLALADLWIEHECASCPDEANLESWAKIKDIVHSLQRRDLLGDAFHLSHGDLAPRNILADVVDESSVEITGVVDWDFACFAPRFCAYRAPMDLWDGDEGKALESCNASLIRVFEETASEDYVRCAFSKEAKIGRAIWSTVRSGMLDEDRRWRASKNIWDWERLHPEDDIGRLR